MRTINKTKAVLDILERNGVEHIGSFLMKSPSLITTKFKIKDSGEEIAVDHEVDDMDGFAYMFVTEALNYSDPGDNRIHYGRARDIFLAAAYDMEDFTRIKTVKDLVKVFPDKRFILSSSEACFRLYPQDTERILKGEYELSEVISGGYREGTIIPIGAKIDDIMSSEIINLKFGWFADDPDVIVADIEMTPLEVLQ